MDNQEGFAPRLHTERLTMKILSRDDDVQLSYIADLFNRSGADVLSKQGHWDGPEIRRLSYSLAMQKSNSPRAPTENESGIYLVYLLSNPDQAIGCISLCRRNGHIPMDFGFVLEEEYQRQGYGTEASARVLLCWTAEFGLKDICLMTAYENIAANKLAIRLGFEPGGWVEFEGEKEPAYILSGMKPLEGQQATFWGEGHIPEDAV